MPQVKLAQGILAGRPKPLSANEAMGILTGRSTLSITKRGEHCSPLFIVRCGPSCLGLGHTGTHGGHGQVTRSGYNFDGFRDLRIVFGQHLDRGHGAEGRGSQLIA